MQIMSCAMLSSSSLSSRSSDRQLQRDASERQPERTGAAFGSHSPNLPDSLVPQTRAALLRPLSTPSHA